MCEALDGWGLSRDQVGTKPKFLRIAILTPLLNTGLVEMTIPDKPNSRLQKYRLTENGKQWVTANSSE
jgi:hypothetical protein